MRLQDQIHAFADRTVVILGDLMLDSFVYGDCLRISPEAPIPVLTIERKDVMLGGAGNVARNIAALQGRAVLIGAVGNDAAARELRDAISDEPRITADLITDPRPTTCKVRYIAGQQQMLRVDIEQSHPVSIGPLLEALDRHLGSADVLVISDYAKGVVSPDLLARAIERGRAAGIPVIADPKSRDVARYDGVTVLTPNAREAAAAVGFACDDDTAVEAAAGRLLDAMPRSRAVLVTRGAHGMMLSERGVDPTSIPAIAREVFDVSGAGDTVVATVALGLAAGLPLAEAAQISNTAAGLAVSKVGTAVVTADELIHEVRKTRIDRSERRIASPDEAREQVEAWRAEGFSVGFTNGCFDLLHPGHIAQLARAREQCDRLIVGLNDDRSVARLKGPGRPVQDESARAIVLASLNSVDLVVPFADDTPVALIEGLRPDVLVKGKDYQVHEIAGADFVQSYGGRVVLIDLVQGHSTTGIVDKLRSAD